jgi:hypothetical protein
VSTGNDVHSSAAKRTARAAGEEQGHDRRLNRTDMVDVPQIAEQARHSPIPQFEIA